MNYYYRFLLAFVFLLSGCVNIPQDADALSSDYIRSVLATQNTTENANTDAKTKVENIWALFSDSWEGGANGGSIISRSHQIGVEIQLFSLLPDHHRAFDLVIVEPPFPSVVWGITATSAANGYRFTANGMFHAQDLGMDLGIEL